MNFKKYHVSRNLFDENYPNIKVDTPTYRSIYVGDGTFTLSTTTVQYRSTANLFFLAGNVGSGASTQNNGVWNGNPKTVTAVDGYVTIAYRYYTGEEASDPMSNDVMLNTGSTPLPYEPYSSEVWHDTPHYIHNTSTDTITTLPAVIYPNAATATVGLKGNMSQTGTPTPTTPIQPQETGERTGNLAQWEKGGINTSTGANEAYRTKEQGGTCEQLRTQYISCIGDHDYVLSVNKYPVQSFISFYDENKNYLTRTTGTTQGSTRIFRANANAKYMRTQIAHVTQDQVYPAIEENAQFAITLGSTPLPYEPYGYKIPISSASTTTPVYLGEVESTRRIKKLVLTGEETDLNKNISSDTNYLYWLRLPNEQSVLIGVQQCVCTHLNYVSYAPSTTIAISTTGTRIIYLNFGADVMNAQTSGNTVAGLKEYLAAQYANGTPVTVWYVLATPETAVVNEPLRKIGDYADTLSNVTIPVTAGGDTLSVDTTLQPSEVSATYKGWHPAIVHEHTNGAWT